MALDVTFDEAVIDPSAKRDQDANVLLMANYPNLARDALVRALGIDDPGKPVLRDVGGMISNGVRTQLRDRVLADPSIIGTTQTIWVLANAEIDSAYKGQIDLSVDESRRKVNDRQVAWMKDLSGRGILQQRFNTGLFTFGASSRPETAGMGVAILGSLYMMMIVLALALPIGVAASIYLEEFAPKNRLTDIIEVNINNLAAVPLRFQKAIGGGAAYFHDDQVHQQPGRRVLQAVEDRGISMPGGFRDTVLPGAGRQGIEGGGHGREDHLCRLIIY